MYRKDDKLDDILLFAITQRVEQVLGTLDALYCGAGGTLMAFLLGIAPSGAQRVAFD